MMTKTPNEEAKPIWAKWIAYDRSLSAFYFENKPSFKCGRWVPDPKAKGKIEFAGDVGEGLSFSHAFRTALSFLGGSRKKTYKEETHFELKDDAATSLKQLTGC